MKLRILLDDLFKLGTEDALWMSNRTTLKERMAVHQFAHSVQSHERERIIEILRTAGAEFLTSPELNELVALIKKDTK